jgi:uncharacterized membrane protein YccC
VLGLIALRLELFSLPLMLIWCAVAMFLCGWLALGKRPYQALLIGITLAVVGGACRRYEYRVMARWRRYFGFVTGDAVYWHLAAAGIYTLAYPIGALCDGVQSGVSGRAIPNLLEQPRLEKHLQQLLSDVVKMRGLIVPASKETRIQKSIFEAIQTVNRNLVCMLELQINALWASRTSHFVMLNAQTLRETQLRTQQALLTITHALYEGNPQPVLANTEKLNDTVAELRQLIAEHKGDNVAETPIHGYVWLNMEMARQLELLSHLICRALRK